MRYVWVESEKAHKHKKYPARLEGMNLGSLRRFEHNKRMILWEAFSWLGMRIHADVFTSFDQNTPPLTHEQPGSKFLGAYWYFNGGMRFSIPHPQRTDQRLQHYCQTWTGESIDCYLPYLPTWQTILQPIFLCSPEHYVKWAEERPFTVVHKFTFTLALSGLDSSWHQFCLAHIQRPIYCFTAYTY